MLDTFRLLIETITTISYWNVRYAHVYLLVRKDNEGVVGGIYVLSLHPKSEGNHVSVETAVPLIL